MVKTVAIRKREPPPVLDPEVTARAVAQMALGRAAAHRERVAQQAQLLTRLAEMDLDELRRHSTTRQWLCAAAECSEATGGGDSNPQSGEDE